MTNATTNVKTIKGKLDNAYWGAVARAKQVPKVVEDSCEVSSKLVSKWNKISEELDELRSNIDTYLTILEENDRNWDDE